jgi:transcription elongation factor SPT6
MYAFCSLPKHPGYFWLCFQPGKNKPPGAWPVKVIPNAFEMHKNIYPDMTALKNGFKMLYSSTGGGAPAARPQTQAMPRR